MTLWLHLIPSGLCPWRILLSIQNSPLFWGKKCYFKVQSLRFPLLCWYVYSFVADSPLFRNHFIYFRDVQTQPSRAAIQMGFQSDAWTAFTWAPTLLDENIFCLVGPKTWLDRNTPEFCFHPLRLPVLQLPSLDSWSCDLVDRAPEAKGPNASSNVSRFLLQTHTKFPFSASCLSYLSSSPDIQGSALICSVISPHLR